MRIHEFSGLFYLGHFDPLAGVFRFPRKFGGWHEAMGYTEAAARKVSPGIYVTREAAERALHRLWPLEGEVR